MNALRMMPRGMQRQNEKLLIVMEACCVKLETQRLLLRPWEETDAADLYKFASAPEVGPAAGWAVHTSVEESLTVIREVLSLPENFAIVDKQSGCVIGSIGLMVGKASCIGNPATDGELGYWIGRPYWGQGLMPEAVQEILRYAFVDLHLGKVWCGYFDGNVKSKRVQEKCGFQYQYTRKDVLCSALNEVKTEYITCLSKEDWEQWRKIDAI